MEVYSFSGVLTALANMSVIVMVVYFGKLGFYTALTILMIQFPLVLSNILIRHNFRPLPGLFNNLFTIFVIVIIYVNHCKVDKFQERLRDQAVTDTLTGLPNRFACTELINSLVDKKTEFAVVSVDLNNFKSINDTMGHNTGNEILKEIAERWKKVANERLSGTYDFVARLGGDEYAIILRSAMADDLNAFLEKSKVHPDVVSFRDYEPLFEAFDSHEVDVLAAEGRGVRARAYGTALSIRRFGLLSVRQQIRPGAFGGTERGADGDRAQ